MSTAHDALAAIRATAAQDFATTGLSAGLSPVTRRVRRHRAVRAATGSVAGIAALGAGVYGYSRWGAAVPVAPASTSPSVQATTPASSATAEPSGSPEAMVSSEPVTADYLVAEGDTIEATVTALATVYSATAEEARAAIVAALPPEAEDDPEGWVSPGSELAPTTLEEAAQWLVDLQLRNLQSMGVAREDWKETLTIASILVGESGDPYNWTRISEVIHNRLDAGMMLQLESPLYYITGAAERRVTDDGFAVDSPYNTFMYEGLPPTPIGSSGLGAVDAAAHPESGDLMFFLIDPETGDGHFAETFHQHQLNAVELGMIEAGDVLPE
ncbi:endolytic transglycosylase MltG [Demequina gelatinilytica]|uniref:endolytic transglycosylase MltG n=1 Tax=Demequina gelatinilytica TaxID=1638980 RepID=UPI00078404D5|nr:endolytic transglycosylase MltG [Demequina gelatinilytica]